MTAHIAAPKSQPDGNGADLIVRSWTGPADIRKLMRSSNLRRMYDLWLTLVQGKLKLPRLNEFLANEPQETYKNAMLLLRLPGDFMFVQQGAGAVELIGTKLTGLLFSERRTPIAIACRSVYEKCVEIAEPCYVQRIASVGAVHQHFMLEQIALPLATDERREVGLVLVYSEPLDDKSDVLKMIVERSPIGVIAATSDRDEAGQLAGGRILLVNAQARALLNLPVDAMSKVQTVHDLVTWFRDGALWRQANITTESKQTKIHYRNHANTMSYCVTIEPIERFVLFSIIESQEL